MLAERAAWDFIKNEGGQTELSVINPTATFGPTLGDDISASLIPILTLLSVGAAQMANFSFSVADVRDIADIHVRAMTHPLAAGERFIACCDGSPITMGDAARILSDWTGVESAIRVARRGRNTATQQPKGEGRPGVQPATDRRSVAVHGGKLGPHRAGTRTLGTTGSRTSTLSPSIPNRRPRVAGHRRDRSFTRLRHDWRIWLAVVGLGVVGGAVGCVVLLASAHVSNVEVVLALSVKDRPKPLTGSDSDKGVCRVSSLYLTRRTIVAA